MAWKYFFQASFCQDYTLPTWELSQQYSQSTNYCKFMFDLSSSSFINFRFGRCIEVVLSSHGWHLRSLVRVSNFQRIASSAILIYLYHGMSKPSTLFCWRLDFEQWSKQTLSEGQFQHARLKQSKSKKVLRLCMGHLKLKVSYE